MSGRSPSAAPLWLRGLALAAVLVLGLLIGRATSSPSPPPRTATPARPGTARTVAGVPVAFPDTAQGAAEATAAYEQSFASPEILAPGALRARIEAVAMPAYAGQMLAANSPGERRIAAGPIGQGLAADLQTIYAAVPIGYRVESYSPGRARILTWGFTLLGNASAVEPTAYFGLTHTELLWSGGQWRIAETRGGFGPTPRLGTKPGPLGGYRVLGIARRLRSYGLAP